MSSTLRQRARLRSQALLEPYETSLDYLRSRSASLPIIDAPSLLQARLEGLVFSSLRTLLDSERGQPFALKGLEPKRIHVSDLSYTLWADNVNLAETIDALLPSWSRGDETVENGIPGLRYCAFRGGRGVSFYFPGQVERFNVLGVSFDEFEEYRRALWQHHDHVSVRSTDAPHSQELRTRRPNRQLPTVSAIARRLGILVGSSAVAVDSWWTSSSRFTIELSVPRSRPNPLGEIVERLQSRHFPTSFVARPGTRARQRLLDAGDRSGQISLRYLPS